MASVLALTTAPTYGADLAAQTSINVVASKGIEGDRHFGNRRAVTIVCTGELAAAAVDHGVDELDGVTTRRNIVVDLPALPREHGAKIRIGATEFEVWRDCAPCELMDEFFGAGAKEALKKRCGVSASVVTGGTINIGDDVELLAQPEQSG